MAHLLYGVENSEAITMITGAIGTGKTMVIQSFATNLNRNFRWALITNTQVNSRELLKLILDDLGVEFPNGCDKSELLILFKNFLIKAGDNGQRVMIIIDEAQNLDREVLEEIRLLTNLGQGEAQPVQVVLVGQPELQEVLKRQDLAQLKQRIRVHYHLEPLTRQEVNEYLDHRMTKAGGKPGVFKSGAVDRIYEFSGGVPRLVNSMADQALLSAYVGGRKQVQPEDVSPLAREEPVPASRPGPISSQSGSRIDREIAAAMVPSPVQAVDFPKRGKTWERMRRNRGPLLVIVVIIFAAGTLSFYRWGGGRELIGKFLSGPPPVGNSGQASAVVSPPDTVTAPGPADIQPGGVLAMDSTRVEGAGSQPRASIGRKLTASYYVQVASFRTIESAGGWCRELETRGFETRVQAWKVSGEQWYRVLIGPYPNQESAKEHLDRFPKSAGEDYFPITTIDPDTGP